MKIDRRRFVTAGVACGLAAGLEHNSPRRAAAGPGPVTPVTPGPEVEAFKAAQQALLKKYAVTAESKYLKLAKPSLTAHVLEAGRGDPVVMLHGGGGFACLFAPLMGPLQKEARVLAVDRPGCGLTDKFDYRDTRLRPHAVEFVTGVLDALDLPRAALVGGSMGGLWALQFALAEPERVTRLVLVGEPAWSGPETHPPAKREGMPTIDGIRAEYAARAVADVKHVPDEMLQAVVASRRLPGADTSWNSLRERFIKDREGAYHLRPDLKTLRPPTLFIWGDKDAFQPPKFGEEMAKMAPRARCEVVRAAGHHVWVDQPERVAGLTLGFLKEGK